MRELGGEIKRLEAELAEIEARRDELGATLPNLPDPDAPDGGEDDAVTLREVGERPGFEFEVRDHLDLGIEHGWIDMEKAAAASGARFAYLLGDLVMVELALIRFAVDRVRAEGFKPVVPPVLVREGPLYGTGFFPGRAGDDLRGRARRAVPGRNVRGVARGPPRRRDRRRRAAAAPLRRDLDLLPARGRRRRQGHPRDLPRPPVRQGRDVLVRPPRRGPGRARAAPRDRGGDPPGARDSLPRGRHRGRRPRRAGGPEVRLRGVDPEPGALPRAHLVLEHDRLPGAPPGRALPAAGRRGARGAPHAERDRGRGRPHADRAARERPAARRERPPAPGAGRRRRPGR